MKATLEFKIPEEAVEYRWANSGHALWRVIHEVAEHLRKRIRHEDLSDEVEEALIKAQNLLWEEVQGRGLGDLFE